MKRIISILLTGLMLFSAVAIAQAQQAVTSTPPTVISSPTDPLADLIANETNAAVKEKLQTIENNRLTIKGLRETFAAKVKILGQLIANMPNDDDNEALEKAREVVANFEDRLKSGIEHDQKIARHIEGLRNHVVKIRQNASSQDQNNLNGERRRTKIRKGGQDVDERKNAKDNRTIGQNRKSERNEGKFLRRVERILSSQERIIDRLERRIERIDDLIEELTP